MRPDGGEEEIPLAQARVGGLFAGAPGESIPVDGEVVEGRSRSTESMLSGESIPVEKSAGDFVVGGSLNGDGVGDRGAAGRERDDSRAHRGDGRRGATIARADPKSRRRGGGLVCAGGRGGGGFVFFGWLIWGPAPAAGYGLVAAISVLIIACPCALGLAAAVSVMTAVGRGAQSGILIKTPRRWSDSPKPTRWSSTRREL